LRGDSHQIRQLDYAKPTLGGLEKKAARSLFTFVDQYDPHDFNPETFDAEEFDRRLQGLLTLLRDGAANMQPLYKTAEAPAVGPRPENDGGSTPLADEEGMYSSGVMACLTKVTELLELDRKMSCSSPAQEARGFEVSMKNKMDENNEVITELIWPHAMHCDVSGEGDGSEEAGSEEEGNAVKGS
jgi:hypothetical protein